MLAVPDRAAEPEEPSPSSISEADLPIIFAILQDIRQLSHSTPIATRHQFSQRDTRGRTGEEQPSKSTHLLRHPPVQAERPTLVGPGLDTSSVLPPSGRCRWAPDRWSIPRRRWVSWCWTDGYGKEKCPFVTRLSEWRFRYSDRVEVRFGNAIPSAKPT
ncbi:hypothetical protein B296_00047239 [Ensete ventricosum]|uniref:Uncharacterized protein n=1 Tax=Ensete ventricosum TaxID=4639 RepID=A0A426X724_ENSVE|nr:hypothetical protein B296_00047239 [Ensete ventricosum]